MHLKPSTWGNQRGARSYQAISGAVAGDSTLQDRGVAHYLLPLLFSLVSLTNHFSLKFPLSKATKNCCLSCSCLLVLLLVPLVLKFAPGMEPLVGTTLILSNCAIM